MNSLFNVTTNNVKGLATSRTKRLKIFLHLQSIIKHLGFVFLQETHSSDSNTNKFKRDFGKDNELFLCHGASNARGVAIGICGDLGHTVKTEIKDPGGRFIILHITIGGIDYVLANIYNENKQKDQLKLLDKVDTHIDSLALGVDVGIILAGDFNFYFDKTLEATGGNPETKTQSIAKFLSMKEKYDLCDIWRIRNENKKRYTFRQRHYTGFLQRRLDYIFISNHLQPNVKKSDINTAIATDHSPVSMSLCLDVLTQKGAGFWKFNSSLIKDALYKTGLIDLIRTFITNTSLENKQVKWELLKYEVKKFTIAYSKKAAKQKRMQKDILEKKLESLRNLNVSPENEDYKVAQEALEEIYEDIAIGIRIRSKCDWYELGEKSTKFFLNLEKKNAKTSTITTLTDDNKITNNQKEILDDIGLYYKNLFKNNNKTTIDSTKTFLQQLETPRLTEPDRNSLSSEITIDELYTTLLEMADNKSPGNDGLTCEFYKQFWDEIKIPLFESIMHAKACGELSPSQRQAIIRLIEKKDSDKTKIANWRPISLLNVDTKILSKTLANRLRQVLDKLISSNQTAYIKDRFIGEAGRLLSDILETTDKLHIGALLVTVDFQKAFDSLNHTFVIESCRKFGIPDEMLEWFSILLNKQESCVINAGSTTKYFNLERGARQGDPIAAYLFILSLEMLFIMIKANKAIKPLEMCDSTFLYSAYADDATFFLKDEESVKALFRTIKLFSSYSDLKPNKSKCEVAGIGVLKGASWALCGLKLVDLTNNTMKILGLHYSYNEALGNEKNFSDSIKKIENVLRVWRQRNLTLEGKITIFKTLAISKIVFNAYLSTVPVYIIEALKKIQSNFLWNGLRPKIKHDTLCNSYEKGGLQSVDIILKLKALQLSWVKRLYDNNPHQWKTIPLFFLIKAYGPTNPFHSHFSPKQSTLQNMPKFYQNIIINWSDCSTNPICATSVLTQVIWNNAMIKIDNSPFRFKQFEQANIKHVFQICNENGSLKNWNQIKAEFDLPNSLFFKYAQLKNSIPPSWKEYIRGEPININTPVCAGILQSTRIITIDKLISKQIYTILIRNKNSVPTAKLHFDTLFPDLTAQNWLRIYILPRLTTRDAYARVFQYKLLNNTLYLNKKLYLFGLADTKLCPFCNENEEDTTHLFSNCRETISLWQSLQATLPIPIPDLAAPFSLLGFFQDTNQLSILINHLLLIFKIFVYKNRNVGFLSFQNLLSYIRDIATLEMNVSAHSPQVGNKYLLKWRPIYETIFILPI